MNKKVILDTAVVIAILAIMAYVCPIYAGTYVFYIAGVFMFAGLIKVVEWYCRYKEQNGGSFFFKSA